MKLSPSIALTASLLVLAGCTATSDGAPEAASAPELGESAEVVFREGAWEPTWSGAPHQGGRLRVSYDFARLPQCRNQGRLVSWVVEVSFRFDGGAITTVALPGSPGAATTLPSEGIVVPRDAHRIELWFENRAVGGYDDCAAWDSHYGANYAHDIAP